MQKLKEEYFINVMAKVIWSRVEWSRRFIRYLDEKEVEEVLLNESPEVFINEVDDKLTLLPMQQLEEFWTDKLNKHIAPDIEDIDVSAYELGYCYSAELWKAKTGQKVLLLRYHH